MNCSDLSVVYVMTVSRDVDCAVVPKNQVSDLGHSGGLLVCVGSNLRHCIPKW